MENTTRPGLPGAVVDRATHLIAWQEITPESFGSKMPDGRVTLCAGAALAVAGLELLGCLDRAEEIREGIADPGAEDSIRKVFVEQGWTLELCDHVVLLNNLLPPEERTQGVMDYFHTLRSRTDTWSGITPPPRSGLSV